MPPGLSMCPRCLRGRQRRQALACWRGSAALRSRPTGGSTRSTSGRITSLRRPLLTAAYRRHVHPALLRLGGGGEGDVAGAVSLGGDGEGGVGFAGIDGVAVEELFRQGSYGALVVAAENGDPCVDHGRLLVDRARVAGSGHFAGLVQGLLRGGGVSLVSVNPGEPEVRVAVEEFVDEFLDVPPNAGPEVESELQIAEVFGRRRVDRGAQCGCRFVELSGGDEALGLHDLRSFLVAALADEDRQRFAVAVEPDLLWLPVDG